MEPIRVVSLDDYQDVTRRFGPWDELGDRVELVTVTEHLADRAALVERLQGAAVVLAMRERTVFDRDLLASLPDLRLLVTKGTWNAAIDLEAADDLGIVVSGTHNASDPTAELTWALILALCKHVVSEDRAVRDGGWQRSIGRELAGATLGVVGLGNLGTKVARVGQAFGMEVIAWSQNLRPEAAADVGVRAVPKETLLRTADIVTIHLKLSARTRGIIGAAEIDHLQPTALLVNTSRGPLVDEEALRSALHAGAIAGAGIDVYETEPLPVDHPWRSTPNTVLTPHVGYVTEEGYRHHFTQAVEGIAAWLDGAPIRVLRPASD